jgi:hypothetical protein
MLENVLVQRLAQGVANNHAQAGWRRDRSSGTVTVPSTRFVVAGTRNIIGSLYLSQIYCVLLKRLSNLTLPCM